MKVGDLVRRKHYHNEIGIILDENCRPGNHEQLKSKRPAFQRLIKILWSAGGTEKSWSGHLEVISESR